MKPLKDGRSCRVIDYYPALSCRYACASNIGAFVSHVLRLGQFEAAWSFWVGSLRACSLPPVILSTRAER